MEFTTPYVNCRIRHIVFFWLSALVCLCRCCLRICCSVLCRSGASSLSCAAMRFVGNQFVVTNWLRRIQYSSVSVVLRLLWLLNSLVTLVCSCVIQRFFVVFQRCVQLKTNGFVFVLICSVLIRFSGTLRLSVSTRFSVALRVSVSFGSRLLSVSSFTLVLRYFASIRLHRFSASLRLHRFSASLRLNRFSVTARLFVYFGSLLLFVLFVSLFSSVWARFLTWWFSSWCWFSSFESRVVCCDYNLLY